MRRTNRTSRPEREALRDILLSAAVVGVLATPALAIEVQEFTDKAAWEAAVGEFTTITFTELPENTWVTDQYADLGVLFTGDSDSIRHGSWFQNDGVGLDGNLEIRLEFDVPHRWIAADFPGLVDYKLYRDGEFLYRSDEFGSGAIFSFGGIISSEPFDMVIIDDPVDSAPFLDDLHFGIPTPGAMPLLLFPLLTPRRRRR